jgi:hypothetical protein
LFLKSRNKQTIQRPRLVVSGFAESCNLLQGMFISACIAAHRAGPRLVGATGGLILLGPFKPICLNLFRPRTQLTNIFEAQTQSEDKVQGISFAYGNLSLPAPYFRLFQWCLNAPYRLAPPAARLASSLDRPWLLIRFSSWKGNASLTHVTSRPTVASHT